MKTNFSEIFPFIVPFLPCFSPFVGESAPRRKIPGATSAKSRHHAFVTSFPSSLLYLFLFGATRCVQFHKETGSRGGSSGKDRGAMTHGGKGEKWRSGRLF